MYVAPVATAIALFPLVSYHLYVLPAGAPEAVKVADPIGHTLVLDTIGAALPVIAFTSTLLLSQPVAVFTIDT